MDNKLREQLNKLADIIKSGEDYLDQNKNVHYNFNDYVKYDESDDCFDFCAIASGYAACKNLTPYQTFVKIRNFNETMLNKSTYDLIFADLGIEDIVIVSGENDNGDENWIPLGLWITNELADLFHYSPSEIAKKIYDLEDEQVQFKSVFQ